METVRLVDGRAARIVRRWPETTRFDGRNSVGRYTGDQFRSANMGLTRTGRWVLIHTSDWQGERPWAEEITPSEAAGWFAACEYELPEELEEEVI